MTREEFIDNACRWLVEHSYNSDTRDGLTCTSVITEGTLIDDFRKAMTKKTNPIFKKCLAQVNPDIRAEVRRNMDSALVWHKVSEELPEMAHFTADGDYSDLCVCINESGEHKILVLCEQGDCTYWAYGYDGEDLYDEELEGEIVKWMKIPNED